MSINFLTKPVLSYAKIILPTLALGILAIPAQATLTMTYSGTFNLRIGTDTLGLNGADFVWVGIFDETATRVGTNTGTLSYYQALQPISFTISSSVGGISDGTYAPFRDRLAEVANSDAYRLNYGEGDFDLSDNNPLWRGADIRPGDIRVPNGFTGASNSANTLTPFEATDVTRFDEWDSNVVMDNGAGGLTFISAFYTITNGSASATVPEPSSLALLGLGGLLIARRRRS